MSKGCGKRLIKCFGRDVEQRVGGRYFSKGIGEKIEQSDGEEVKQSNGKERKQSNGQEEDQSNEEECAAEAIFCCPTMNSHRLKS